MKRKNPNYEKYFSPNQQARIVIRISDSNFVDRYAEISSIQSDLVWLELLGYGISGINRAKNTEIKVSISTSSGWGLFRCGGVLEEVNDNKKILIRLVGQVEEQQRREYFRLDVEVPLIYSVPGDQHVVNVTQKWNEYKKRYSSVEPVMFPFGRGYKVVKWLGGDDLLPVNVNLSGGGLRIKTPNYIEPGTWVLTKIFLPLAPSRAIPAVAQVVRSNEIQLSYEKGTSYTTAMKFTSIEEKDREAIISFVFCEQRNQLKADTERRA